MGGWMERRTDNMKTVYPPQTQFAGGKMTDSLPWISWRNDMKMYKQTKSTLTYFRSASWSLLQSKYMLMILVAMNTPKTQ